MDGIKHSLGRWNEDLLSSGLHARRLALALAREHLGAGHDVIVGQYLARTDFIEDLERLAAELGARFSSSSSTSTLPPWPTASPVEQVRRPARNTSSTAAWSDPTTPTALVSSLGGLRVTRPGAVWIDARGSVPSTLDLLRAQLR